MEETKKGPASEGNESNVPAGQITQVAQGICEDTPEGLCSCCSQSRHCNDAYSLFFLIPVQEK